eukprot:SAG31_NODE_301_length_18103_cov_13.772551_15_plen_157_part_00
MQLFEKYGTLIERYTALNRESVCINRYQKAGKSDQGKCEGAAKQGKGLLSLFCATIREVRDFNREMHGANRESVCINKVVDEAAQKVVLGWLNESDTSEPKATAVILKTLYDHDMAEEDLILEWAKGAKPDVQAAVKPIIDWLEEADEDDDDEDED